MGRVVERGDLFALVVIADAAFEDDERTRGRRLDFGSEGRGIDGLIGDGEHRNWY